MYFSTSSKKGMLVIPGWEVYIYADAITCFFLPKRLHYHCPWFPTSFMCCPWLVLESCEVWLKLAGELIFPVPYHTIKMSKCLKGEGAQHPDCLVTAHCLKNWAGLFENFKKKWLMKWWIREPRPCQEMKWWHALGLLRWRCSVSSAGAAGS